MRGFKSTAYEFVPGRSWVPIGWPLYDSREVKGVVRSLVEGRLSQGKAVKGFEEAFAGYVGARHGVAVNSGSSANLLALAALLENKDLSRGQEVIVPAATFATVAAPILQLGLVPVYVDVEMESLNLNPEEVEKAVGPKTGLVMPVHSMGNPADMKSILKIAGKEKLRVLEDCCEAHGASIGSKKVGSFGDLATYSFFVAHNITTGEGGMVLANSAKYEKLLRSLREFGRVAQGKRFGFHDRVMGNYDARYLFERLGFNVRMTDLAASFGLVQLEKLERFNRVRRGIAGFFTQTLRKYHEFLQLPVVKEGTTHAFYGYPLVVKKNAPFTRKELTSFLESKKIETRPFFAGCLPDQPGFRKQPKRVVGRLPNARHVRDHAFFIGCHQAMDKKQRDYVAEALVEFLERHRK